MRSSNAPIKVLGVNQMLGQCVDKASFNTLMLRQNDRHFPDDIFKSIFLNKDV